MDELTKHSRSRARHGYPLIGKLLRRVTEDGEYYTLSRFTADLGGGCFLARRIGCVSGKDLDPSHILFLPELVAAGEGAEIFNSWEDFCRAERELEDQAKTGDDKVVRLVPKWLTRGLTHLILIYLQAYAKPTLV
jgi:hypothetical protein